MNNRGNGLRLFIILIALSALTSCSSSSYKAPIVDAEPVPSRRIKVHHVAPGETLYSIALRYDLDYKEIAKINNLNRDFHLSPGQLLSLEMPAGKRPVGNAGPSPRQSKQSVGSHASRSKNRSDIKSTSAGHVRLSTSLVWQWPLKGEVLEVFQAGGGLNKGIDIRGKLGEPVLAAADGEVVYSGSGLRGYGNLVIVKHSEQFLSAYAHNRVLAVTEGDKVKVGQKIAEVGFSGTNTAKLHFEIRLDGKPVDPMTYLPRLP